MTIEEDYDDLHLAITNGEEYLTLTSLLHQKIDEFSKQNLLRMALEKGHLPVVKFLLDHGANPKQNLIGSSGKSGLEIAIEKCHMDIVKYLLEHGVNVNEVNFIFVKENASGDFRSIKRTPIEFAIVRRIPEVVEYFFNQGADINVMTSIDRDPFNENSYTLLHKAVDVGDFKIAKLLLEKGADVNAKTKKGAEPSRVNSKKRGVAHFDCNTLNSSRRKFYPRTLTVLEVALLKTYKKNINLILDYGAAVGNESDQVFALHIALGKRLPLSIIERLVERGADVNSVSSVNKCTPLSHALLYCDHANVALYLLKKGATCDISKIDSLLHKIVVNRSVDMKCLLLLLDCGANVNSRNKTGKTPLHFVIMSQKKSRALMDYGANVNAQDKKGDTPCHQAVIDPTLNTILLLIEYDADFTILNNDRDSPLAIAIRNRKFRSIIGRIKTQFTNIFSYFCKGNLADTDLVRINIILAVILREASGKYVDERDLMSIRNEPLSFLYNHFKKELEATKLKKIRANVSYYDILTKSTSMIETYLNKNDLENMKNFATVDEFPFYSRIFASRLAKIKERKILVETSDQRYKFLFRLEYDMPITISVKISSYLSSVDFITLWRVFQRPGASIYTAIFKSS